MAEKEKKVVGNRIIKTPKQVEAVKLLSSYMYCMLFGGSRSGKTFITVYAIFIRAMKCPNSRHIVLRFKFNACKKSIGRETIPKVIELLGLKGKVKLDKQDWFFTLPNGSEIWIGGLDDKERAEKILGTEYSTIYFNEASQLSYGAFQLALTRLAQRCSLSLRCYLDCNPPSKKHWTYSLFILKKDPIENVALRNPDAYSSILMNPTDNAVNIGDDYIENVLGSLNQKEQKRFLLGMFSDDTVGALWKTEWLNKYRCELGKIPPLKRIVVAVDPAVTSNPDSDDTGIIVGGISMDNECYIFGDYTTTGNPYMWAKATCKAYDEHSADKVIGENNNGGDLVEVNIRTVNPNISYKGVRASRGKFTRAEPIASLTEKGKIHIVGMMPELEEELTSWVPDSGDASPNRLDAMVWLVTELMCLKTKVAGVW